jgi:hypothetical protein
MSMGDGTARHISMGHHHGQLLQGPCQTPGPAERVRTTDGLNRLSGQPPQAGDSQSIIMSPGPTTDPWT